MNSQIYTKTSTKSNKMWLWIFFGIVVATGIGILIWQLTKGGDGSKKDGDGSPRNWAPHHTEKAKNEMGKALPLKITNCVVKEYSKTHSYNDFLNKKDFQNVMPTIFSECLGKIEKWDSSLKKSLIQCLDNRTTNKLCGKCVIKEAEKTYSPLEFLKLSELLNKYEYTHAGVDLDNTSKDLPPNLLQFWKFMKSQSITCECTFPNS